MLDWMRVYLIQVAMTLLSHMNFVWWGQHLVHFMLKPHGHIHYVNSSIKCVPLKG
jgi:hypothetical protein